MEETTVQETVTSVVSMSDKLQGAIGDLITKSLDLAEVSGEFLVNEIPDVVYQLMLWHGVKSGIYCLIGILLPLILLYINYRLYKWVTSVPDSEYPGNTVWDGFNEGQEVGTIVYIISSTFICVPIACININIEWLQIWIAPKVWLLEYAGNFIK
jgi:hypothetical protein